MKFATCELEGKERPALVLQGGKEIVFLEDLGFDFADMNELIKESDCNTLQKIGQAALEGVFGDKRYRMEQVKLRAPIPYPTRVIGLGLNYQEHSEEMARALNEEKKERTYPIYWEKGVDRCPGHMEEVPSHADFISTLDYETELGVVLWKEAKNVPASEVESFVFGYTVLNDITARELSRHKQNYFMKSLDGTCPIGPWIVTADEISWPPQLRILCHVNQEKRQDGNTKDMIFNITDIVSGLTRGVTLPAGTILATGSPTGIGFGMNPPVFLKDGDVCRCEIEGIGVLENRIADHPRR